MAAPTPTTLESSSRQDESAMSFRGHCLYKTGKCKNERALKTNGQAHNLCDEHRAKQNQNQRKMDSKMRQKRHYSPYESPQSAHGYDEPLPYPPSSMPSPYPAYPTMMYPPAYNGFYESRPAYGHLHHAPMPDVGDQITVPTPSYLKGEAREAFRSRVLQKLVNIISEEVTAIPPPPMYSAHTTSVYEDDRLPPQRLPSLASRISRHGVPSPESKQ
ncbi:hypothetical protein SPRG_03130 [Saprolegnia parasitica CBS 223.65]|uniref:Uncharacterized protein n=1 Tax=Saprolegnia parasitica (strain CBS 223.65) TaxID=695850 RepID=A0A067CMI1_SAPPC|nr:hypothetical protein SPRG_03130 [Saprolegnia parasitica CBS 223.65]KDO31914.1 hypothetical protein SPRG_03130 [Saprolegnia parasitica CBS 223.65]|eukprot:XP_012197113.1 hypothetical protein SPRG_03130 [Saprolegnia parasitica CBS 223.65]